MHIEVLTLQFECYTIRTRLFVENLDKRIKFTCWRSGKRGIILNSPLMKLIQLNGKIINTCGDIYAVLLSLKVENNKFYYR